jgi:hypothetical protein
VFVCSIEELQVQLPRKSCRVAKEQFPFLHTSAYSRGADADFNEASAGGMIPTSLVLRVFTDIGRVQFRQLRQQGYPATAALDYLRKLAEAQLAQLQAQPQSQAQPFPSPFAQPINGQPHVGP